jgi:hypothetical protein
MQRWIVMGVVGLGLLLAVGFFGYREYLRAQPASIWVPLPVNPELSLEKRTEAAEELKKALLDKKLLLQVAKDVDLAKKWGMASNEAAAEQIEQRLFVRPGEADTPNGRVAAIHIGVTGKGRERDVLAEVTTRLMKDVFRMLGIEEQKKPGGLEPPPI